MYSSRLRKKGGISKEEDRNKDPLSIIPYCVKANHPERPVYTIKLLPSRHVVIMLSDDLQSKIAI